MQMKNKILSQESVWQPDLGDGTYKNPIIHADYSDPDVIRVGSDYFMVASSFNMSPCMPVLHSKDLVHWKIINHVFEHIPYERYNRPRHGEGVWAPAIRYHDGYFWVFFGAPDEGIFMSKTKDPYGKWSPLHLVKEVKGWIDPCPFWDEDGKAYLVHAFAKSRIGFKSLLQICRMKPDGTELLDEGKIIFDGTKDHPTIEGPKMYKRNGYYYIFAPAGGVATGWQTILRSKSVFGPYEDKVVLHQGSTEINGPHQGGWVETDTGESWFIHFQDKGAYGRITHLQPMRWEKDWPVMGSGEAEIGEPVLTWKKPNVSTEAEKIVPQTSDDFQGKRLGLQWQWRANVQRDWYTLDGEKLILHAKNQEADTLYDTAQIMTQKFPAEEFVATTAVTFQPEDEHTATGLYIGGYVYGGIQLKKAEEGLSLYRFLGKNEKGKTEESLQKITCLKQHDLLLRVTVQEDAVCQLSYSTDGENYITIGEPFQVTKGHWIGAVVGIFCVNEKKDSLDDAFFHWFQMESMK